MKPSGAQGPLHGDFARYVEELTGQAPGAQTKAKVQRRPAPAAAAAPVPAAAPAPGLATPGMRRKRVRAAPLPSHWTGLGVRAALVGVAWMLATMLAPSVLPAVLVFGLAWVLSAVIRATGRRR